MFYTYIIQSKKDSKRYTGCTNDLRKRFKQHNNNDVVATKGRGPFELIYYEACKNESDAFAREKYLKSGPGKLYLKNRLKRFLSLTGSRAKVWIMLSLYISAPQPRQAGEYGASERASELSIKDKIFF